MHLLANSLTRPGKDYMSTLPHEIVIQIISEVSLASFLDLMHTSSRLRVIITNPNYAAIICNRAIFARFPQWADLLEVTKTAGWLVPNAQLLQYNETTYMESYKHGPFFYSPKYNYTGYEKYIKPCSLHGPISFPSGNGMMWISAPGPQLLYFLEQPGLKSITANQGKDWYEWRPFEIDYRAFSLFMDKFNDCWMDVGERGLKRTECNFIQFPRELGWYYGIENAKNL